MTTRLLILCSCFYAAVASAQVDFAYKELESAARAYDAAVSAAETNYRKELAAALGFGDKIELFVLDLDAKREPQAYEDIMWELRLPPDYFPITPYKYRARILARTSFSGEELQLLLPALRKMVGYQGDPGVGPICHLPERAIRVWRGEKILFQTSLCWRCGNYYVAFPSEARIVSMGDSEDLHRAVERLVPVVPTRAEPRKSTSPAQPKRKRNK